MCAHSRQGHRRVAAHIFFVPALLLFSFDAPRAAPARGDVSAAVGLASGGGALLRAMNPHDLDDDIIMKVVKSREGWCEVRSKVRAEIGARLGLDFGRRPQSIVLELRPDSSRAAESPAAPNATTAGGVTDNAAPKDEANFEFIHEICGDMEELCERFLRNASVAYHRTVIFHPCHEACPAVFDCSGLH